MPSQRDECRRIFEELEAQREATLAELGKWPVGRLNFRPGPDAWSAVEVLDHIVRAESGTIDQLEIGLRDPHPIGMEERPGIAALDGALRSDRRFQVPKSAEEIHPDSQTTLAEVAERWGTAHEKLSRLVQGCATEGTCGGVFEHPFAGWMTFAEVLDHFSAHRHHHEFQLERLRVESEASGL